MTQFTDSFEQLLLNYGFNAQAVTRPTTWFIGIVSATGGGETGDTTNEFTAGSQPGYARQAVTFGAAGAGTGTKSQVANTNAIQFLPSGGNWPVGYARLFTTLTGNTMIAYNDATQIPAANDGVPINIAIGDLKSTLD